MLLVSHSNTQKIVKEICGFYFFFFFMIPYDTREKKYFCFFKLLAYYLKFSLLREWKNIGIVLYFHVIWTLRLRNLPLRPQKCFLL